jgi:hypothetical protein
MTNEFMTVIYDKEGTYFLNFIQEVTSLSDEKLRYNKCINLLGEEYSWIANYHLGSNVPMDGILEIAATINYLKHSNPLNANLSVDSEWR